METIAAISTAMGSGGIGIIRMTGKDCFKVLKKIFKHCYFYCEQPVNACRIVPKIAHPSRKTQLT